MDETVIERAWGLQAPVRLSPLAQGTNNLIQRVETPAGSYVLRIYSNHADRDRLRFEHAVLRGLEAAGLPFAVPTPMATTTGELYTRVSNGDGEALATLTRLIPGAHPQREDLAQAAAAGEAIGLLDVALARIALAGPDEGVNWRSYGDLEHCHPLVPDPATAIGDLPLSDEMRARLLAGYDELTRRIPALYARLPRQLVHEDTDPSNILMNGTRVTGILDFEFCARDVRVMDLTVALSWWPSERFGTGAEWPMLRALARGFGRAARLAAEEIAAIPTLFQVRAYTSLIHRLGRSRQGLSPLEAVLERAHAAIEREDWLRANGDRLAQTVLEECG